MKKLILIFAMSVVILGTVWYFRSTTPTERNDTVIYNKGAGVWWDTTMWANVKTDPGWILDPDIPANYIPVLGAEETYMVLNEDGTVNRYRKRFKDDAGNCVWSDIIEDDMPVSFRPSAIDDDIYSYIGSNGVVELYRYVRNGDDSYAFVPVDEDGNDVGYDLPQDKQRMFVCRYWYAFDLSEIARRLGMTENNVSVTLNRLRKKLRKYLIERGFDL